MNPRVFASLCLALALGAAAARAQVAGDTFGLSTTFPGKPNPGGAAPWVTATVSNASGGDVLLTLIGSNLTGSENIKEAYLNFNPSLDASKLTFTLVAETSGLSTPTIASGNNAYKADGDGYYDMDFSFTPGSGGGQFVNGDEVEYKLAYSAGSISSSDFLYSSVNGGGEGSYYASVQIQNLSGGGSTYVGALTYSNGITPIPEYPAAAAWLGAAAAAFALARRRLAAACA